MVYVDPLADDAEDVVDTVEYPAVVLLAHNRYITYGYTGQSAVDQYYYDIPTDSIIVDPWRSVPKDSNNFKEVVHYGNTRPE